MRHPLQGLSVPPPEPELRARVLAAAAATARDPRLHWIDRIYEDLVLRRAFLVLVLATGMLLALDLAPRSAPIQPRPAFMDEQNPPAEDPGMTAAEQEKALGEDLG